MGTSVMATVEVEVQNEDNSDKRTIFRYRKLYDMFLFISILLLFINYFTVQRELEELREYLGSGGERGQTVHEGDKREPDVKPSSLLNSTDTGCASGWSGLIHTGQCYKHIQTKTTWTEARKFCQNLSPSADLASIPDKITNDFLTNLASSKFWTGGFKNVWENGGYVWVNGDKWTGYTAWAKGEPNGGKEKQCIEVHTESSGSWRPGLWNDATFTDKLGAMCQYKKIPTTGKTVHEGNKREPDVKPSSVLNSTDPGFPFWLRQDLPKYKGITYNNSGKISSGSIIKIFDELSPFYTLKTKVKVNKYTRDYAALWHFTTGPNCCVRGSRIPGIFILPKPYNRFQVSVDMDNNVDYAYQWNFTLNTWYEIELSQTKEGNNGRLKLVVNGVERRNVRNTAPRSFTGVKVYQGSPNSYTDGVKNPATPDIDYEYFYYENHDPANDG